METAALRDLLATRLGLDADSLGPWFLSSVARWGLQQSGHRDLQAFVHEAAAGGELWQRLIEHVVVAETWFFRDTLPFELIADTARAKQAKDAAPVRVLSCPCSTGEEPFSVAIALADTGPAPDAIVIDAADVSPKAIAAARAGAFRARSFRPSDPVDRGLYFDHDHGARLWRIKPAFRTMVRFAVLNVVSPQAFENAGTYDVVLCRNLLIYLHAEARAEVMASMRRLLSKGGVLIVGHAEAGIAREHGFKGTGNPKAFAFVDGSAAGAKRTVSMNVRRQEVSRKPAANSSPSPKPPVILQPPHPIAPTLEHIRQLGDLGRTEEAVRACREYVRRVPDSAEGHFLLGVLCGALGQEQVAEAALRRALYLEPNHVAALQHLALTRDARGDGEGAARLRARAERSLSRRSAQ